MRWLWPALFALSFAVFPPFALAQDFSAAAEDIMGLSFDLDRVEGMLMKPARMASHPGVPHPSLATPGYVPTPYVAPLPLEPNSDLDTVTVFRDRALVTRVIVAEVEPDGGGVVFEGLPLGLAADGLYASVRSGDGRIVGVEIESGRGEVEETERIEEIRAEMLEQTAELGLIRDRIEALLAQRTYLRSALMRGPGEGQAPELAQVKSALEYVGETEQDIAQQLREEQKRAQELDEEIAPLLIKLENPLATGKRVRVDLDLEAPDELTVALRYQVWGASWTPSYNARLDQSGGRVELEYYGVVTQTTGEEWVDAELLLSTANPATSGSLPEITPWYLGRDVYGYDASVMAGLASGGGHFQAGGAVTRASVPMLEGVLESHMNADVQGRGAVIFAIPGRRTVAGDGSAQRLPVGTQTFGATLELATVPKLIPEVFRRARIRYDGDIPLIPGPVASYVGTDYVGTGYINAVVPGEPLTLSFGTDDRLKVTRRLVSREVEYLGVGRRMVRYTFDFRVTVANFTGEAQEVEMTDQLPIAEMDRVQVKVLEVTEGQLPADDQAPGVLKWKLTVPKGGESSVVMRFSVTAPAEAAATYLRDMELMY
ncbi:MAG: mucoidy inhibitor MuiA family protein [Deltaproteobacteria bacterium]|nr:mucoidy inhibitor MuiA family protein [Deltaproteobacteria bacterium]